MAGHDAIYVYAKSKSGDGPHEVAFEPDGDALLISCSCPAGEHEKLCRHVIAIIKNDPAVLDSPTAEQHAALQSAQDLLRRTRLAIDVPRLQELETLAAELKRLQHSIKEGIRDGFPFTKSAR